ncbi:hypothetical protein [Streptomyces olivochromogenes]|uniref:hypothetical protein n=1 Tax=Streptomyces olivochromogenes TaxID=1963 RepID=UPI0031342E58
MIYESRLELARLLFADFDPLVRGIVAQPFLLKVAPMGSVVWIRPTPGDGAVRSSVTPARGSDL